MKSIRNFLLIAIIIFVVSACAPKATQNPPAPQPTAVSSSSAIEVATQTEPQPTAVASINSAIIVATPATAIKTDAEMEALIFEKVHDKHTVEFILSQNKTAGQWSSTLDMMIGLGAKITPDEKTLIINWLVARKK